MEFVGRSRQLGILRRELDEVRSTRRGRLVSVRGRRRVGKSTLVQRFLEQAHVPHVFFAASRQPLARELELFLGDLAASELPAAELVRSGVRPDSWDAALTLVASATRADQPIVVVLDEFPFLVEQDAAIEGTVQKIWDLRLQQVPVLLILIGSDLAMMEALTTYGRALHGRPSREMVVEPLTPREIAELLRLGAADALDAYVIVGGFPQLAGSWGPRRTRRAFLRDALADDTSPLIVSGERAITAEFPPQTYARAVLSAIGAGEASFGNIGRRSGQGGSQLTRALDLLEAKRAVTKLTPFGAKPATRLTRYVVVDPYLRFWLRFVEPSLELIQRGRGRLAFERVERSFGDYRGRAIEPIVRGAIEQLLPDERFGTARHVRGFWTRDNRVEVDLVGAQEDRHPRHAAFVGSIKWRDNRPFGRSDVRGLISAVNAIPATDDETLLVGVSRAGFSGSGLDVQLGPDEIVEAWR